MVGLGDGEGERKREANFNKREADEKNKKSRTSHKKQQKRSTETISMKIKETLCFPFLRFCFCYNRLGKKDWWGIMKKKMMPGARGFPGLVPLRPPRKLEADMQSVQAPHA